MTSDSKLEKALRGIDARRTISLKVPTCVKTSFTETGTIAVQHKQQQPSSSIAVTPFLIVNTPSLTSSAPGTAIS